MVGYSKIHVFEPGRTINDIVPRYNVDPSHEEGIERLLIRGKHLYSASKDATMTKWDLEGQSVTAISPHAHSLPVTGLVNYPIELKLSGIVSSSQDGTCKFWSDGLEYQGQAHSAHGLVSSVEAIATNSKYLFTAGDIQEQQSRNPPKYASETSQTCFCLYSIIINSLKAKRNQFICSI
jgi:WD40 repeat protein